MKACPAPAAPRQHPSAGATSLPRRLARGPWRARRVERLPGLVRAPRIVLVCHLWRRLFPAAAATSVLADILANIGPYVLRRGGRGARSGLPAAADRPQGNAVPGALCGGVPPAARAGSGR